MASKLVGVRLPEPTYRRLQQLKRDLGLEGDAEAIRALINEYSGPVRPSQMPVFSTPLKSRGRRPRALAAHVDEHLYGRRSEFAPKPAGPRAGRGKRRATRAPR